MTFIFACVMMVVLIKEGGDIPILGERKSSEGFQELLVFTSEDHYRMCFRKWGVRRYYKAPLSQLIPAADKHTKGVDTALYCPDANAARLLEGAETSFYLVNVPVLSPRIAHVFAKLEELSYGKK